MIGVRWWQLAFVLGYRPSPAIARLRLAGSANTIRRWLAFAAGYRPFPAGVCAARWVCCWLPSVAHWRPSLVGFAAGWRPSLVGVRPRLSLAVRCWLLLAFGWFCCWQASTGYRRSPAGWRLPMASIARYRLPFSAGCVRWQLPSVARWVASVTGFYRPAPA